MEVTRQTYLYAMLARALREGPVQVHISDPKAPVTEPQRQEGTTP